MSTTDVIAVPALTAHDRCDGCGAQAYLAVEMPSGTQLLFCKHHGEASKVKLLEQGARVTRDEIEKLSS